MRIKWGIRWNSWPNSTLRTKPATRGCRREFRTEPKKHPMTRGQGRAPMEHGWTEQLRVKKSGSPAGVWKRPWGSTWAESSTGMKHSDFTQQLHHFFISIAATIKTNQPKAVLQTGIFMMNFLPHSTGLTYSPHYKCNNFHPNGFRYNLYIYIYIH